jgi:hypothetical protein
MKTNNPRFAILVFVAAVAASCFAGSDGLDRLWDLYPAETAPQEAAQPDDSAADLKGQDAAIPPEDIPPGEVTATQLSGAWVMRINENAAMDILGGRDMEITNLLLVEIAGGGKTKTDVVLLYCEQIVFLDAGGLGETHMPAKTNEGLGKVPLLLEMSADGTIAAQKIPWTWGLKLDDPLNDPVPPDMSPTDPAVWDQDEDGHPGVAIEVKIPDGTRHMVRREIWDFKPGHASPDLQWISGGLSFTIDHVALEASAPILMNLAAITDNATEEAPNSYVLRRVTAGQYDCQKLIAEHESIFKDSPAP